MEQIQRKGIFKAKIKGWSELCETPGFAEARSENIKMGQIKWFLEIDKYEDNNNRYYFWFRNEDDFSNIDADVEVRIISKTAGVEDIRKYGKKLFYFGERFNFYEVDAGKISNFVENDEIEFEVSININRVAFINSWDIDFTKPTKMSDAVLVIDGEMIHVNKTFLSIHSSYFKKLFWNSGPKRVFKLDNADLFFLPEFLRHIHVTDYLLIDEWRANLMLECAEELDFPHIFHVFANYMLTRKEIEDICELFRLANKFKSVEIQNHLLSLMSRQDMKALLTDDYYATISSDAKLALVERIENWNSPMGVDHILLSETDFNSLDFSKPTKFWDVILIVEGQKIHVNKTLLAMCSSVFEAMFFSEFKEKNQDKIELKEVEYDAFIDILTLIYPQAGIHIREDNVENILQLADRFDIRMARHLCEEYLIGTKEIANLKKLQIAEKWSLKKFQSRLLKSWKSEDIENLMKYEEFRHLEMETIESIIHRSLRITL